MTNRAAFRQMLDRDAIGIVMFDTGWVGGISEGHAIGRMAETYHRPLAPHDCTGPVTYIAGTHLCQALPNAMIQEGVRAYYAGGWYEEVVTELPMVANGMVSAPDGAGLGTRLRPDFLTRPDVVSRTTEMDQLAC
jgi:L-alanine-DL-glutamate epimerase-like enolase superfamily enzyme